MRVVIGLGSSRGVRAPAVRALLQTAVSDPAQICAFATVDRRRDEPGLLAVIGQYGVALRCYSPSELDLVDVPNPSEPVRGYVGTRSVAEAAALLAARDLGGGALIVPKLRGDHVTVAVAELGARPAPWALPAPLSISTACTACGACLLTCPERALRPAPRRPVVVEARCTCCGDCVEICPTDAITLRD